MRPCFNYVRDMIKKIIFIIPRSFRSLSYLPSAAEILRKNGFEFEVWDISSISDKAFEDPQSDSNETAFYSIRYFNSRKSLADAILDLDKHCFVNCFVKLSTDSLFIYRALSNGRIKYGGLQMMGLPSPIIPERSSTLKIKDLGKGILSSNIRDIFHHFLDSFLLKHYSLFRINAVDVLLLGGEKSLDNKIYPRDSHTKLLWAHSFDYDTYLKIKDEFTRADVNACVFLDEFLPFHTDYQEIGVDAPVPANEYYPKLCRFFDYVEQKFNLKILIAVHPKSDYENKPDYFHGRVTVKGDTAHLVKDASFVLAHMSTSINFAILFNKPILFITLDRMQNLRSTKANTGLYIDKITSDLMTVPVNIDHMNDVNLEELLHINQYAYDRYKNNYIKKDGSPDLPFWEIFSSYCRCLD